MYMGLSSAPPVQLTQLRGLGTKSWGGGLSRMTSDTYILPPGFRMRNASRKTASLSGARQITQFDMTTSADELSRRVSSISARWNSVLHAPIFAAFLRARSIMSRVMSIPITLPEGPTARAARKQSIPPPLPKSTTVSPSLREPSAIGFPHPAAARTASSGSPSVCPAE